MRASLQHNAAAMGAIWFTGDVRAEMTEHFLGMIARGFRFNDRRAAGAVEPCQQDGGFDLGGGDRGAIFNWRGVRRALQQNRAAATGRFFHYFSPHQHEGIENAAHRALAERGIAIKPCPDAMTANQSHHQTASSASIAKIQRVTGGEQRAKAGAVHAPAPATQRFDFCPQRRHGLAGVEHIVAFQQSLNPGFTGGQQAHDERAVRNGLVPRRL